LDNDAGDFDKNFSGGKHGQSKRGHDHRYRDKIGKIERKHGNTKVAALRREYGENFAKGRRKDMMLKTLLKETGSESLHDYLARLFAASPQIVFL
jgi:hypothetical protein